MNKTLRKTTAFFLALLLLLACQLVAPSDVVVLPEEAGAGPTPDVADIVRDYPRVDGSTSAHPLQMYVACEILEVKCEWMEAIFSARTLSPDNSIAPTGDAETVANIWHNGTHSAYVNLINKDADFIIVARMPSKDEIREAGVKGVKLDIRPIALDAFVFLAHVDNPVGSLTLEQIREIYTGKITSWFELGGTGKIHAYQRNRNSGSQELMDELVMQGDRMIEAPDMIFESMVGPINAIRDDTQGLGYSVFFYATFMLPDENVKLLGIDGVVPTSDTIASREYSLVTEVYAVVREKMPANSTAVMLRDWLLTEAGQAAVEESGYVPIK
jgi:phosphate transport system substrate-binding protein